MSTKNLLELSVRAAQEEVVASVGSIAEMAEALRKVPDKLLTEEERKLLAVSNAVADSNLPVINIAVAIRAGGVGNDGLPRLAVAAYTMSISGIFVHTRVENDGQVQFGESSGWRDWEITFPAGTLTRVNGLKKFGYPIHAFAPVPLVPPSLRKVATRGSVVLFEVTNWTRESPVAVDPYLLLHIAGNVYVVAGTWDVTERELAAYQAARDLGL